MTPEVQVLIPTCGRPGALAVTLTALSSQTHRGFSVLVSDQTRGTPAAADPLVVAATRLLESHGAPVRFETNLPPHGMAQQRQFLLERTPARYALFLDDDISLDPRVLGDLVGTMREQRCGFVGCGLIGLSHAGDVRPEEQAVEFWDGPVLPERVRPGEPAWDRYRLHNAANLLHVQRGLGLEGGPPRPYKVAWVGGCVLYDTGKLRACGGFGFWPELPPEHAGEDVLAQLLVMERFGGCAIMPSGAYHLELPTTLEARRVDAPRSGLLDSPGAGAGPRP